MKVEHGTLKIILVMKVTEFLTVIQMSTNSLARPTQRCELPQDSMYLVFGVMVMKFWVH
jgi:hypothetical protein